MIQEVLKFMSQIKWELTGNDPNDLKAFYRNYSFRIEKMNKGIWWYAIYQDQPNPKNIAKTNHVELISAQGLSKSDAKFRLAKDFLKLSA